MATSYVGYRNVLQRGTFPLDPDTKRHAPYSLTGVLNGFPDNELTDEYDPLFGNAKIELKFQPMADPGDRSGEENPNPLYHYGVPGSDVLGSDEGWSTDESNYYIYYGLATATVLDEVGADTELEDYYHFDRVSPQALTDPGRTGLVEPTYEDELNVWHGVPSAKAL